MRWVTGLKLLGMGRLVSSTKQGRRPSSLPLEGRWSVQRWIPADYCMVVIALEYARNDCLHPTARRSEQLAGLGLSGWLDDLYARHKRQ